MNNVKTVNALINKKRNPWSWIPTLYFAEGLPYVIVMVVSVIMYKRLGISNADIALYTSWLYLPWVIKPLWSPIVDIFSTKRKWIIAMQLVIGAGMAGVAFTIPMPDFFQITLAVFFLIAFSSATHDISADGFYMIALDEGQQSFFVGIRSTFYRIAMIAGQGLLIVLAGYLETTLTVSSAEIKVAANPDKFFEETVQIDSLPVKQLPGNLRIVVRPSDLEIGTRPISKSTVNFYIDFARKFNIMNGFIYEGLPPVQTTTDDELVGNIGIVKFYLSKKPEEGKEYTVNLNYIEGSEGISVIEGGDFRFTSTNWNKPAFAVFQIDPSIQQKTSAVFRFQSDKVPFAWVFTFAVVTVLFVLFFIYHKFMLPKTSDDKPKEMRQGRSYLKEFFSSFFRFFEKEKILLIVLFLLFYRLGESQLSKMAAPFLLDPVSKGGLGLSTTDVGFVYGTVGIIALVVGGILGGLVVSRNGLKKWLWIMLLSINIPDLVYVYLAYAQPSNIIIVYVCVAFEQFGYGFGFTAYMMYMIYVAVGEFKTSHFAIATGFMALGMMVPGMFSGIIQEAVGYKHFFIWVCLSTIPAFIITKFIPLEYNFGKKKREVIKTN